MRREDKLAIAEQERNGIVIHVNVILVLAVAAVAYKYLDYRTKVKK